MSDTTVNVVEEMKQAYGDYALAVLIGRAIPDLYDGLKPVTRRVLTAMKWLNLRPDGRFMKAARVEGETMGKLHPHGGAYGAMVTAAQWWTNNNPLVDGHGNWGSPTDNPAAARYTEAKLTDYSYTALLSDTSTWLLRPNYDDSLQEPVRLNAQLPNVLVNGGEGIGVGFATRIPTHNLRGIAKAIETRDTKELIPDFPTGCDVVRDEGLTDYLKEGRGSIRMRAKVERSEVPYGKRAKRDAFTFTNFPMHVNTEQVGEQIKDNIEKGNITTVADVRDETDRTGTRLVVICKANVNVDQAESEIYRYTSLDCKFSASNLVIDGTKPVQLAPLDIIDRWMVWRDERFLEATKTELGKLRHRLEVVNGMMSALDMIDEIVDLIKRSKDKADARKKLMARDFTELQANAILDMRLAQLTKLDDKALRAEGKELQANIRAAVKLTSSKKLRKEAIIAQVNEHAVRFGNTRRSKVIAAPKGSDVRVIKQGRQKVTLQASGPKPRFILLDEQNGVITQQRKMERKSWVVQGDDKLIFVCDNGQFYKLGVHHRGPIAGRPTAVLFRSVLSKLPEQPLIAVYKIGDALYGNAISWEALTKCTSRGKAWLPEGAELIHLGGSYELVKQGRKKNVMVTSKTLKARPVGGKGSKLALVADTDIGAAT